MGGFSIYWLLALMLSAMGATSSVDAQTLTSGPYTQSLFPLVDGTYSCVLILQPQISPGGEKYDFSIWVQTHSTHIWFALHDKTITSTKSISLYDEDKPVVELQVIREARPSTGVDAIMADASGGGFLSKLLVDDNRRLEFRVGPTRYPIPTEGLSVAIQNLDKCGKKLG